MTVFLAEENLILMTLNEKKNNKSIWRFFWESNLDKDIAKLVFDAAYEMDICFQLK